ncbi:MAG TPA: hypothetical protein VGY54_22905 [Polyangiaceae bacterium]|jgi:hypothetical protein|nr:hypothetical protein [Polyangiaceae bacterium]
MSERHEVAEMIGEAMREIGVLVAVFGMLDKILRNEGPTADWTAAVLVTALFFFVFGVTIERRR